VAAAGRRKRKPCLAEQSRALEQQRIDIPRWVTALDRRDAQIKEQLRPFALKLCLELPGRVAKAISEIESAGGVSGEMRFWNIGQALDASIILNPLRRLHELSLTWLESLQRNDDEARECRIRVLLADSGVLKPRVYLFRR
jgi:hypothetical protein